MDMDLLYRDCSGSDCQHEDYPVYEIDLWHSQNAKNHDFVVQFLCKPPRDFFSPDHWSIIIVMLGATYRYGLLMSSLAHLFAPPKYRLSTNPQNRLWTKICKFRPSLQQKIEGYEFSDSSMWWIKSILRGIREHSVIVGGFRIVL